MSRSMQLKEDGNRHFLSGDYIGAEGFYSKAILADPKNPILFTNRAMARLKLSLWDSAASDCNTCLVLAPSSMKAHYYLCQAQLGIGDYDAAVENALKAHEICVSTNDRSLAAVTGIVLRCKKKRWEQREKARKREAQDLERELLDLLAARTDEMLVAESGDEVERDTIREEGSRKLALLRDVFERARSRSDQERQVPDWAIDDISFGVMVDPVVTKTGKSYERASIMEHLRRHPTDPLTREPLLASEIRPNLALRQACNEYLEENGWAVDW
ncbi:U-box domain-containing protein [Drechmeria coniospora]|uniref:U-box domain-containing protein n=1 Tax=Drechmeria coniospora TaxID=98403 RepID=A0A151GPV2_DRECN|nr:U-box domain-containing protein [Drechmeria coniospora]KYK59145.1 U-box domain-containing protein [Drechmeria coniospora]ODA77896.1 hypothetical protein RJ55_06499 [Drechmeria coniospora]